MEVDNSTYYIEPACYFLNNLNYTGQIVVYKDEDVIDMEKYGPYRNYSKHTFWDISRKRNSDLFSSGINEADYLKINRSCHIEMVADHTLYQFFRQDEDFVKGFLYFHAKYTDNIFRRTDFNGDGEPDNIRIIVKSITVYKSIYDPNYPMALAKDLKSFLTEFTERTQYYCLSVAMCFRRDLSSPVIGQAFKPGLSPRRTPGGICQKPLVYFNTHRSLNTAVVTVKSSRTKALPLITTLLAIAHEIGHSFGSEHDPLNDLACSPGGAGGFYLMYPNSVSTIKPRNAYFSPCSENEIYHTMLSRGECLKEYQQICGNGFREGTEECDCGVSKTCDILDRCCIPSDAKPPEKGCTFRRQSGSQCSPRENPCCSIECTVERNTNKRCFYNDKSCHISYCDGVNAICPKPVSAPDKYPCHEVSKTCNKGSCNSTVCLDNGLKNCICSDLYYECAICCMKNNVCSPAYYLGLVTVSGDKFVAVEGSRCNSNRFQCDSEGNCVNANLRVNKKDRKYNIETPKWWVVATLIVVILLIVIPTICYLLRQHIIQR
ncbi:disintegrin and metalloproteinase domain-containing protein 10-like [Parasteatoda tepidariorum]|uniref:disintegrin and metalloproteinase domain-containing protein 10-like n=1 Tax=Parasteatoda tepidariorum TaxID=114398 RepID=UPI0039BD6163